VVRVGGMDINTLDAARNLASQTMKAIKPDVEDVEIEEIIVQATSISPAKVEDIRIDNLVEAVDKVNRFLPEAVDELISDFRGHVDDDGIRHKPKADTRRRIFETLAKFSLTDDRLQREFGFLKEQALQGGGVSIGALLNIDMSEVRRMGHGSIDKLLKEKIEDGS